MLVFSNPLLLQWCGASGTDGPSPWLAVEDKNFFGIRIEQPEADFGAIAKSFYIWSKRPSIDPNGRW